MRGSKKYSVNHDIEANWDTGTCCIEWEVVDKQEQCTVECIVQLHESIVIWLMQSHENIAIHL